MLIDIDKLHKMPEFANVSEMQLENQMIAIESIIREYTKNNFQNRKIRFKGSSDKNSVYGVNPYIRVGDTVQISESVNNGLYVIKKISDEEITVDKDLFTVQHNLVTKVEYPADVVDGAVELLKWRINFGSKVGIKSETVSRHSVTYYDNTASNTNGFPTSLMGFLTPYMKARF